MEDRPHRYWHITFELEDGVDEDVGCEIYDLVEKHPAVAGAGCSAFRDAESLTYDALASLTKPGKVVVVKGDPKIVFPA